MSLQMQEEMRVGLCFEIIASMSVEEGMKGMRPVVAQGLS